MRWVKGQSGRKRGTVTKPTDVHKVPKSQQGGFLDTMDGRAEVTKMLRHRLSQLVADLGGLDNLSYMEQSLCRRIVHLERLIEKRELTVVDGGPVDENLQLATINCISGLFSKLGLKRRARKINSLNEFLKRSQEPQAPPPTPQPTEPQQEDSNHGNPKIDQRP